MPNNAPRTERWWYRDAYKAAMPILAHVPIDQHDELYRNLFDVFSKIESSTLRRAAEVAEGHKGKHGYCDNRNCSSDSTDASKGCIYSEIHDKACSDISHDIMNLDKKE